MYRVLDIYISTVLLHPPPPPTGRDTTAGAAASVTCGSTGVTGHHMLLLLLLLLLYECCCCGGAVLASLWRWYRLQGRASMARGHPAHGLHCAGPGHDSPQPPTTQQQQQQQQLIQIYSNWPRDCLQTSLFSHNTKISSSIKNADNEAIETAR